MTDKLDPAEVLWLLSSSSLTPIQHREAREAAATLIRQMQAAMVEADRRAKQIPTVHCAYNSVSDAVEPLAPYLPKVDPLVEAIKDMMASPGALSDAAMAHHLRAALSCRGGTITWKDGV